MVTNPIITFCYGHFHKSLLRFLIVFFYIFTTSSWLHWMTISKFWPKPIPRLFSDTKFSKTDTETFFRYQIFRNRNRDFFSDTKFSKTETETLKTLAKVSKPRSFETKMSISAHNTSSWLSSRSGRGPSDLFLSVGRLHDGSAGRPLLSSIQGAQ